MPRFYFTYGLDDDQPFEGGWTEIVAPNMRAAEKLFEAVHPCLEDSYLLNCAGVYTEEQFTQTKMFTSGNFGRFCHERIVVERGEEYGKRTEEDEPSNRVSEETEEPNNEF